MISLVIATVILSSITSTNAGYGIFFDGKDQAQYRWQMPIYYKIDKVFPQTANELPSVAMFEAQMKAIMDAVKCIRYEKSPNQTMPNLDNFESEKNTLYFVKINVPRSSASTGYQPCAPNTLIVSPEATSQSIIHELGHTLGLDHEMAREDVSDYLKNFTPIPPTPDSKAVFSTYGTTYDYTSIMHYPNLEARDESMMVGQQESGLTETDILILKRMYCEPRSTCKDQVRECGIEAGKGNCANDDWAKNTCPRSCGNCANAPADATTHENIQVKC